MKKAILIIVAIAIVVGGLSFYGGMKYQESKIPKGVAGRNFQNTGGLNGSTGQRSSNFSNGEIVSKDDKSVTIKLGDRGSKIIFYSDTTEISKFVAGTANDLEIGKSVTINGTTNQDGSLTAQSIQIRPNRANQPQ
jgi:hypothetical protein